MSSDSISGENAVWADVKLPPWWLVLIEGILLIIIGIFFFVSPYQTLVTAVWVTAIVTLFLGILPAWGYEFARNAVIGTAELLAAGG